jgi:hypothetical protein
MRRFFFVTIVLFWGCNPLEDGEPPVPQRAMSFWIDGKRWESNLVVYAKKFPDRIEIFAERSDLSHVKFDLLNWLPGNYVLDSFNRLTFRPAGLPALLTDSLNSGTLKINRFEEQPPRISGEFSVKFTQNSGEITELKNGTFNMTYVKQ